MNSLKQILFTFAMVIGLSVAISAQKDDQRRPPPKGPAPKVNPPDKPPPKNTPREDKKPKKPGMAYVMVIEPRGNFDNA